MKIFKTGNFTKDKPCIICGGTNDEEETVLIGIKGTEEGMNIQCQCVHLDCLSLRVVPDKKS